MTAAEARSFSPDLFAFLRELRANNQREWFNANKGRYERHVKEPALAFIEDLGYRLAAVAPYLVADKRSLFRIYRDTRFAKDKSPYKTHARVRAIAARRQRGEADRRAPRVQVAEPGFGLLRPRSPTPFALVVRSDSRDVCGGLRPGKGASEIAPIALGG